MKSWLPALVLLVVSFPAAARDGIAVEGLSMPDDAGGRSDRFEWSLGSEGEVWLSETKCPQCRAIRRYAYRFKVDGEVVRRIDALLPFDLVESTTRAPCTLPHAEAAWAQPVQVSVPDGAGGSRTGSFFARCESVGLTTLRARLTEATLILTGEIARRSIQPEAR